MISCSALILHNLGRIGRACRYGHGCRSQCDISWVQCHKDAPGWFLRSPTEHFTDDFLECPSEIPGEGGVDKWIDGRVAIAQPKDDAKCQLGNAIGAESRHQVHGEERKPTTDETAYDDAQSLGSLRFHSETTDLEI